MSNRLFKNPVTTFKWWCGPLVC